MITPDRQKEQFANRLKRISAGGENTMGQIYVGVAEDSMREVKTRRSFVLLPSLRNLISFPISVAWAFAIGLLAVVIARYLRFTVMDGGLAGEDPDITMLLDLGIALVIGAALKLVFRIRGKVPETFKTAGVVVMVLMMHNLVHAWPGAFEKAFSPAWVTDVIETTERQSILFRGTSFAIGETVDQRAAMQTASRLN